MGQLQDLFDETLARALASSPEPIAEEAVPDVASQILSQMLPSLKAFMLSSFKWGFSKVINRENKENAAFRQRNYRRWRSAFERLEMMWMISEEIGSTFNNERRTQAVQDKDYLFEALVYLHARSLLVTREVVCLLQGGFADGAMSRWRTLHELAVTGAFLQKHGNDAAHRYLASHFFNSHRAAVQLETYSNRANLEPFRPEEIVRLKNLCGEFEVKFGKEMRNDYGWAAAALGLKNPTFAMIEKDVGLDHWRPRYKWASQHTHGPYRPTHALLGMAEVKQQVLLVGPSNSGMVDPLQMTAITLAIISNALFVTRPNVDHAVVMQILDELSCEVGPVATELERKSFEKTQSPRKTASKLGGPKRQASKNSRKK